MKLHPIFSILIIGILFFSCNRKLKKAQDITPEYELEEVVEVEEVVPEVPEVKTEVIEVIEEEPIYLLASLKRTACFGKCPVYEVEIFSDGRIIYKGTSNVTNIGVFESIVPPGMLDKLWAKANTIRYFDFANTYPLDGQAIPDLPMTITYLKSEDLEHGVSNSYQSPKALQDFEGLFDHLLSKVDWKQVED